MAKKNFQTKHKMHRKFIAHFSKKNQRYKLSLILMPIALFAIFTAGCSKVVLRNYYIINYVAEQKNRKQTLSNEKIAVRNFDISTIYDRSQIVIRQSEHRLIYSTLDLWPIRPQQALQNLLIRHLRAENIFQEVQEDYLDRRNRYQIEATIHNIEFYSNNEFNRADLEMDLFFRDLKQKKSLIYQVKRFENLENQDMTFFVKKLSDILREENNKFIKKIKDYIRNEEQ